MCKEKELEEIFTNEKFYKAMKKVPDLEKQALNLLIVKQHTVLETASIMKLPTRNVLKLAISAIDSFKENLKESSDK